MYLSRLVVKNYRSIKNLDLKFEVGKNVIVGRNNAGKSNIVKAIDLILGENSPTWIKSENITDNDFYNGGISEPIFILCELSRKLDGEGLFENFDFSDFRGSAIAKITKGSRYDPEGYFIRLSNFSDEEIEKIFEFYTEEGDAKLSDNTSGFNKYWVGGKSYCKSTFEDEFKNVSRVIFAFRANKNQNDLTKLLAFLYTVDGENWNIGLGGANIRSSFLQSAIIPAFRDPKDQLRITNWSWYGKLLKEYIQEDSQKLREAFEQVKLASGDIFEDLQGQILNKNISLTFPDAKLSFQFNPDVKQDIYKSTLIYVDDGFNSELKDKGSGIQSAVIIGLFDFYIREVGQLKSSILVIEEPELYLHPHGRRVISDKLRHFLDGGNNQVIITTHSSEFIAVADENLNIIVVSKDKEKGTKARNIKFDSPKRKQILIKKQNAEMFFADAVILTEDFKYILEAFAKDYGLRKKNFKQDKLLGVNWLNDYNISIINCGGKMELWKYVQVLEELNIPFFVMPDFDFLRNGLNEYFTKLCKSPAIINKLNAVKSGISTTCKSIEDIKNKNKNKKDEVIGFTEELKKENIFLLSGELENFYKVKPSYSKEQGVLEIISKMIEEGKNINEFVDFSEIEIFFDLFVKKLKI